MRHFYRYLAGAVVASMLVAPAAWSSTPPTTVTVITTGNSFACAVSIVSTWPLVQQANETIAIPVNATNLGAIAPAARAGFGGLLLFGAVAPSSMGTVLNRLQAMNPHHTSMLIMTDEEGGGVQRLTNVVGSIPWAQTMGKNLRPTQITALGLRIGRGLRAAGVNMDLAPVLDVDGRAVYPGASNPDGLRSFSGSASVAGADGVAFALGLAQANVTSVVKHFPGLGGTSPNTDYGPAATKPWATLQKGGLLPFERAIASGVPAIMLSNASVPGLSSLPSTLSPVVIKELRQNLGFQGLIMDDSLSAGAIGALHLGPPGAAVKSVAAGSDMILFGSPTNPAATMTLAREISGALVGAISNGMLTRPALAQAAAHVLMTRNPTICPAPLG